MSGFKKRTSIDMLNQSDECGRATC